MVGPRFVMPQRDSGPRVPIPRRNQRRVKTQSLSLIGDLRRMSAENLQRQHAGSLLPRAHRHRAGFPSLVAHDQDVGQLFMVLAHLIIDLLVAQVRRDAQTQGFERPPPRGSSRPGCR